MYVSVDFFVRATQKVYWHSELNAIVVVKAMVIKGNPISQ